MGSASCLGNAAGIWMPGNSRYNSCVASRETSVAPNLLNYHQSAIEVHFPNDTSGENSHIKAQPTGSYARMPKLPLHSGAEPGAGIDAGCDSSWRNEKDQRAVHRRSFHLRFSGER